MSEWVQQGNIRITSNETGVPASSGDMSVYHLRKGLVEKLSEILWWIFFFQTGLPCVLIICPERSFHLHQFSYCFARMIIIVQLRKFLEVWKLINKFEFRERRSVTPFSLIMSKKKKRKCQLILFDENTWMCFCRDGGDGMCNLFQKTTHMIHEILQISACQSVWYTTSLSLRFSFSGWKLEIHLLGKESPQFSLVYIFQRASLLDYSFWEVKAC